MLTATLMIAWHSQCTNIVWHQHTSKSRLELMPFPKHVTASTLLLTVIDSCVNAVNSNRPSMRRIPDVVH